jgi:multiple sugar transport system substrate-binding protein
LLQLDDYLDTSFSKDSFDPTFLSYTQFNGKLHALPLSTNVQLMHYNKDHFNKAGISSVPSTADQAWTWEQFLGICDKLQQARVADYPYGIYQAGPQGRLIPVYQAGHGLFTPDLKHADLANAESVAALEFIQSLFQKNYSPSEAWTSANANTSGSLGSIQDLYKAGKVSMMHGGQWHIPWARDNVKFPWGVTYLQKQKRLVTAPGGEVVAVFSQTKVPKEATALAQFLTAEQTQKRWLPGLFRLPTLKSLETPDAMQWPSNSAEMAVVVDQNRYGLAQMTNEYYADGYAKTDTMLRARTAELATGKPASQWASDVNDDIEGFIKEGD